MRDVVLGVDVGTSSTKALLVSIDGDVLASGRREHEVARPHPGHVEMDPEIWWREFTSLCIDLLASTPGVRVVAVGASGMGPCTVLTDEADTVLRPAILYGVDTRSVSQIARLNEIYGARAIWERCGSYLSTQAVGPKIVWVSEHEPEVFSKARRLFTASSFLVNRLAGEYVLDHQSASQCTPLYDTQAQGWIADWSEDICPELELPDLRWTGEIAGVVHAAAARATGLPAGTPVITGTIDAWADAVSADAHNVGDLMLMYGTTMFLINTVETPVTSPSLWGTVGALPGTRSLAGGMATSGAITSWLREIFGGAAYEELLHAANQAGPGAHGLLMLPYFAGERTPIQDPSARGVIAGLTLSHTRGDIYRAALEATGFAVRHNIEAIKSAGGEVRRVVATGGGTQGGLWTQIVSDITELPQVIPSKGIGASFGMSFLAAATTADVSIAVWNPVRKLQTPNPELAPLYSDLYADYRQLYPATRDVVHKLAGR